MLDIKYHPLIDQDSDGTEKVPMFCSDDENTIRSTHDLYLEEIVPQYYRLRSVSVLSPVTAENYIIHCPTCGMHMRRIASASDNYRLGLYECPDCNSKKAR